LRCGGYDRATGVPIDFRQRGRTKIVREELGKP